MANFYNNYHCVGCSALANGVCNCHEDGGEFINDITGEVMGYFAEFEDSRGDVFGVCDQCAGYLGYYCDNDGIYREFAVYMEDSGCWYSEEYTYDYCYHCEECGDWFEYEDNLEEYNGRYLCERCTPDSVIEQYHAHHYDWCKVGDYYDVYTIGFELECDGFCDNNDRDRAALELSQMFGNALVYEEDCSLECGFEIISQPHTVDALEDLDLYEVTRTLEYWGASENPCTAGLHLHFSREWFGEDEQEQEETLARLMIAYRNNWDTLYDLSNRRDYGQAELYAVMPAGGHDLEEVYCNNTYSRYYAVNVTNRRTVEFRLGAGYLCDSYIRAWIDLHIEMIRAARETANSTVNYSYSVTRHDNGRVAA